MDPLYMGQTLSEEEKDELIKKAAKEIVDRRMASPAIIMLESSKPISFVGSQFMLFFDPILKLVGPMKNYAKYQRLLEDRDNIEKLIIAIEEYEDQKLSKKKKNKNSGRPDGNSGKNDGKDENE